MNSYLLTNDQAFRRLLEEQSELELSILGWRHLTTIQMRMTLDELTDDMAEFLFDNYEKFTVDPDLDQAYVLSKVEEYLNSLNEEDVRDLYYQYVEPCTVLEDLMATYRSDRISVLADIKGCEEEELERFDTVWAN